MRVALLGDIAFYGRYSVQNPQIFDYFKDIVSYLKSFDYIIGNLETPFIDGTNHPRLGKSAHIYANMEEVELLKYLNITHVNLANNHMYDYGRKGLEKTLRTLEANNIQWFGVDGKDSLIHGQDATVALTGFCCYSTNALGYQRNGSGKGVHVLDPCNVEKQIKSYQQNGYYNIVSMHMGEEHVHFPNYDHMQMARKLSDSGCSYFLYGHHPHVIQGMEMYKQSCHAYSLGNFCFDDVYTKKSSNPLIKQGSANKEGLIFTLEILQNELKNLEIVPTKLDLDSLALFDESTQTKFQEYCSFLNMGKDQFKKIRGDKLDSYYASRKQDRNFSWYWKRLKLNSVVQIINGKKNSNRYNLAIKRYNNTLR